MKNAIVLSTLMVLITTVVFGYGGDMGFGTHKGRAYGFFSHSSPGGWAGLVCHAPLGLLI